jgi:hypothetical protein
MMLLHVARQSANASDCATLCRCAFLNHTAADEHLAYTVYMGALQRNIYLWGVDPMTGGFQVENLGMAWSDFNLAGARQNESIHIFFYPMQLKRVNARGQWIIPEHITDDVVYERGCNHYEALSFDVPLQFTLRSLDTDSFELYGTRDSWMARKLVRQRACG